MTSADPPRHPLPSERYRLYLDESGDHVFKHLDEPGHRYLCLLGCIFRGNVYQDFHAALEKFKQQHFPHNPDEPVILHREDIVNRRKVFWRLRNAVAADRFEKDLLDLIGQTDFRIVAVVIDKKVHQKRYPNPAHPYHLALGYLLQRYCGYLNHVNRQGDVMAESRGGKEDRLLKDSYDLVYERGVWMRKSAFFQQALSSKELKLKAKSANIAGLQLADLLVHPVRHDILIEKKQVTGRSTSFVATLLKTIESKFNRHLYDGRIWGYGKLFSPEIK
ncbi:MAG: DUF3800 domain-containing protein [Candidatus Hydrogenedentes bacterium]|nr:DUF3800 domain-containing protein [Candidatus Hydrogenedentota bacterium]